MTKLIILAERQTDGRFKFVALANGKSNRSLRSWATEREAIRAGKREYKV